MLNQNQLAMIMKEYEIIWEQVYSCHTSRISLKDIESHKCILESINISIIIITYTNHQIY